MTYENKEYEESIDLLALAACALRKWKWMVLAALVGALLLGVYKGVLRPEIAGSETEIEELQKAIDDDTAKLSKNEADIETNEADIATKQGELAADEELLVSQKELKAAQEENLATLRTTLERSEEVLADPNASSSQLAEVIMQILTLSDDITAANSSVNTASTRVSNTEKEISTLQSDIKKLTSSNETLEETNAELRQKIKEQEEEIERLTGNAGLVSIVKYAAMGAVLGAFVFCGIIFLQFILYRKLRSADELKEQYGFPILGEFWSAAAKDHNKFNRMLDRLMGDVQTLPEEQQVYKLIAAGIQTPALALPIQLTVTGTAKKETLREVGDRLHSLLPEGYKLTVAANPVYNPGPLANLKKYTVLLVEEKGVSDKREIAKLTEVLGRNEVKVIGAVVL